MEPRMETEVSERITLKKIPRLLPKFIIDNLGWIIAYIALSLTYLLSFQYQPATITLEMKVSARDTAQVFCNTGAGYNEADSISFPVGETAEYQNLQFQIPRGKIAIRIDPMKQEGSFSIKAIAAQAGKNQMHLEGEELQEALLPLNQVQLSYQGGAVEGVSTGEDPYFLIDPAKIAITYPSYLSACVLLALLLLVWGAKKLYAQNQYEVAFALFLLIFAFPAVLPFYFSFILTIAASLLFLYLVYISSKRKQALSAETETANLKWARLTERRWFYGACLALALLCAFLLRFWNLTILDPYSDEYSHLLAAKKFLDTGTLNYTRASLVTYLVAFFCRIGGASSFYECLFWGRVPGVIFGALTVIPLYFLARKISRPVAVIASFLWAASPWAIGVAKTIREYTFYPFFILLGALILARLMELLFDFKRGNIWGNILKIILCLAPILAMIWYAFNYDRDSTLRICAIVFAGIVVYYLAINAGKLWALFITNKAAFAVIVLLAAIALSAMFGYVNKTGHVDISNLELSDYWFRVFFVPGSLSTPMHWWGDYANIFIAVFLAAAGFFYAILRKRKYYFLHLAVFLILLVFYIFFFERYDRPRYIFYALPFFIPLVAMALNALIDYAAVSKPLTLKIFISLAVACFVFQVFNYQNILYPVLSDEHGYIKTTNEHHDSLKSVIALLEKEAGPDDVFITTVASGLLILSGVDEERVSHYNYKNEERFAKVERIIEENPQGFMILDWRRNGLFAEGYPHEGRFMIGNTMVEVIQNQDGMQVYRWKR